MSNQRDHAGMGCANIMKTMYRGIHAATRNHDSPELIEIIFDAFYICNQINQVIVYVICPADNESV